MIPLLAATLADSERLTGQYSPFTVAIRGNLAIAYAVVDRIAEAVPLLERALADCERVLGPDDPMTLAVKRHSKEAIKKLI